MDKKIPLLLLALILISFLLYNFISGVLKIEEPIFFGLTFLFAFGFIAALIYKVIFLIKGNKSRSL